jgi:16S rRNA (guanine527-N7)-methyltransferase
LESVESPAEPALELAEAIAAGSSVLRVELEPEQINRLAQYVELLAKWNRVYNLTSICEPRAMVALHLLDSLSVYNYILKSARVLDVGSGAGLPGIPLAIASPSVQFVLLDSSAKKTRFMWQAVIELCLANVRVERYRIQNYRPEASFDTVICRAFAGLQGFIESASLACAPNGRMLAMKAKLSDDEQQIVDAMSEWARVYKLEVPGIEGERQLIEILKA